jgi:hypothetical protein
MGQDTLTKINAMPEHERLVENLLQLVPIDGTR